ncbi:MAG: hypothetical protein V8R91_18980 [Butyricimonas faecihominis]
MKRLLLLAIVLFGAVNAWAEEGSKEFKKSFPAASINELTVTNRYGNMMLSRKVTSFPSRLPCGWRQKQKPRLTRY